MRELAAQHGFRLSTDLADAIADPAVQAVFLATPHSLHVPQICQVAAAGKPVWCEKPLALTRKEAARAVAACRDAGVPLGTGNNKRCFASMRELKRVVEAGAIGEVLHIEGHFSNEHSTRVSGGWRDDPRESPGGGMTGAGLHVLDAFVNLAGPISVGRRARGRAEAAARSARRGRRAGASSHQAQPACWLPCARRRHSGASTCSARKGSAEARDEDSLIVAKIAGATEDRTFEHADSLRVLLEAFADAIEGKAPFPVTPAQMLDTIGAFEAVIASLASGAPVKV